MTSSSANAVTTTLTLHNVTSLDDATSQAALRELTITASSLDSLAPLAALPHLERIVLFACDVADGVAGLVGCSALRSLDIGLCNLTDLSPLLELHTLRGTFYGCPWSEATWREVLPALRERHALIVYDREKTWEVNRDTSALGLSLCYAQLYGWWRVLLTPGTHNAGFGEVTHHYMRRRIRRKIDTPDLYFQGLPMQDLEVLIGRRELATADEALAWLDDSETPGLEGMRRFVQRFSGQLFYRETPWLLERFWQHQRITWPTPLRAERAVLGFTSPAIEPWELMVRFRGGDDVHQRSLYAYFLPLDGYLDDEVRESLEPHGILPIGMRQGGGSFLVTHGDRPTIYELAQSSTHRDDPDADLIPAFTSYSDMLDHIIAIWNPDAETWEAATPDAP